MMGGEWKFAARTAWRESRRQRSRLLLCALSIVFGVAALVAVDSFSENIEAELDQEAKTLLGADLQITSRTAFTEETEKILAAIGGDQSREIRFASMAFFPKTERSRLIQVRALGGGFPYYGEFETTPAGVTVAQSEEPIVVLDPLIMAQQGLEVGDTVRLGETEFTISAELVGVPGEAAFAGIFAPRAYIPLSQLESTGLIQVGSLAFYRVYAAGFDEDPVRIVEENQTAIDASYLRVETIEDRKEDIGSALENLNSFLGLVGFVALLLGGVGIAGAVQAYLIQKRDTVAILRCLGSSSRQAAGVFWFQIAAIALVGAVVGAGAGVLCQAALPRLLAPLLPFQLEFFVSWTSIFQGVLYGAATAFVAGLFPLLPLRKVSPLRAIRADFTANKKQKDGLTRLLGIVALFLICVLASTRTAIWWHGLIFVVGLAVALLIFWLVAALLKWVLKKVVKPRSFILRQAAANLHRPQNRTVYLTVSLGIGTFLIYTLTLIQTGLLQQTDIAEESDSPNLLLFDIQPDQFEEVESILQQNGLEFAAASPIVTMRLSSVKGISVTAIKDDPDNDIDDWILNREWRSSYRGAPGAAEVVSEGNYVSDWTGKSEPIPISLEDDMARDLSVEIGDRLTFDVQGIPIEVEISSLRTVDWTQMWPNFFATFPLGVLENAPQWWIAVTRSPDLETTAALQSEIFKGHPNVSVVDLNVVIESLQTILGRINFAVRFMGLFTMATGIIILANAVAASRHQRVAESALLRTLGAVGKQIRTVLALEYALLGLVAGIVGVALALVASSALGIWVFQVDFNLPWLQVAGAILSVVLLSTATGLLCSRGVSTAPPLKVLRGN
ncbi:MAG: FtsX-like permease family protein [Verrucomicrobiota bacterium]